MIPARHGPLAHSLFSWYLRRLLGRSFHALRLLGSVPDLSAHQPVVMIPNHSTWWDGFFVYMLNEVLFDRKLYVMMLAEQLGRFPFFRRVGAFGIRPGDRGSVLAAIRYSVEALENPDTLLCVFPQGVLLPYGTRPLQFRRGVEQILARYGGSATVIPLGMRAEFVGAQRPEVFFRFGRPLLSTGNFPPSLAAIEQGVHGVLAELDRMVLNRESGRILLEGRKGLDDRRSRR